MCVCVCVFSVAEVTDAFYLQNTNSRNQLRNKGILQMRRKDRQEEGEKVRRQALNQEDAVPSGYIDAAVNITPGEMFSQHLQKSKSSPRQSGPNAQTAKSP